jgi:hypothetical protein
MSEQGTMLSFSGSKAFAARCMTESNNDTGLPVVRYEDQQAYNYFSA